MGQGSTSGVGGYRSAWIVSGSGPQGLLLWLFLFVLCGGLAANLCYTHWLAGQVSSLQSMYSSVRHGDILPAPAPPPTQHPRDHSRRIKRQYNVMDEREPSVEFFPQSRPQPNNNDKGDSVWLTSYSKIPLRVLQEFCNSTKLYCPPGDPGPPGIPGDSGDSGKKGERGDRGIPGEHGPKGPSGTPGNPGPIGAKGERGSAGMDGREGLPGYPGLDGVPGRDGVDGFSGQNGIPGTPGTPGRPGSNGTDGIPGAGGPKGPPGPTGPSGLSGPRGRKGIPGKPGTPGVPGINAWKVNGTYASKLLIPPSIVDTEQQTTVMFQEGETVRLICSATGEPAPLISWRREDNKPILLGNIYVASVQGDRINFTRVSRDQMGSYLCIASNGVPPLAHKTTRLEVTFIPLIKIRNQMVGTSNGSYAVLECHVEAFPQAVNYWLYGDGRLLEPSEKYVMRQEEDNFRTHMLLNITRITPTDYGLYKCVSKNEKGKTPGIFTVFETDPSIPTRSPAPESTFVYGPEPPPRVIENECTVCITCPPEKFCPSGKQEGLEVRSLPGFSNSLHWRLAPRAKDCVISQIGKPVFYRSTDAEFGAWMQDAHPPGGPEAPPRFWVALENESNRLYEFPNKEAFRKGDHSKVYNLPYSFAGNSHVIYNGSFYYHRNGTNQLVRFDPTNNHTSFGTVEDMTYQNVSRLYRIQHNYMDLAADENGIWVIYASNTTKDTKIAKIHPLSMDAEYMWNITLDHHNAGEMFVACGVLYAVQSTKDRNTQIVIAFDLYNHKPIEVKLDFTNPFRHNTMISYNPAHEVIMTWDKGNQLIYPVKFDTIDFGQPDAPQPVDDGTDTNDTKK